MKRANADCSYNRAGLESARLCDSRITHLIVAGSSTSILGEPEGEESL